jgi:hypothetical protein
MMCADSFEVATRQCYAQFVGAKRIRLAMALSCAIAVMVPTLYSGQGVVFAQDAAGELLIDDAVAAALFDRGMVLYGKRDYDYAKRLFVEALERSPDGAKATDALAMLRATNERLGVTDLDAGRPGHGVETPLDPYASPDGPLDPYANPDGPLDPYGGPKDILDQPDRTSRGAKRALLVWGGVSSSLLGMALAGPTEENEFGEDNLRGGAIPLGLLTGAGGAALGYFAAEKWVMTDGQVSSIISAGNWAMLDLALLGDVASDGEPNAVFKLGAVGLVGGVTVGAIYGAKKKPSLGDVAFTNSLGLYGTFAGLMLGVAADDPPRGESLSINAILGSLGGIGTGLWLSTKVEMSRRRTLMIDVGAGAGAAASWVLLYPLISDDQSDGDERAAAFISTLTMAGGAIAAYFLTRNIDDKKPTRLEAAPPPGLVTRSEGKWSLGAPVLRPMVLPALTSTRGLSLGVDVVSGRF